MKLFIPVRHFTLTDERSSVRIALRNTLVSFGEGARSRSGRIGSCFFQVVPFPKNPVIAKFFRQIGRAGELGSGMRNMMKFSRAYGGADPELIEGDVFRIVIKVPESGTDKGITGQAPQQVTQQVMKLLVACNGEQSRADLMQAVEIKDRVSFARNYLDPAIEADLIEMTQPDSPQSPTQKYRLTEKGRQRLKGTP